MKPKAIQGDDTITAMNSKPTQRSTATFIENFILRIT
uniref:Uncharacterized protein n=1 Tax=Arundo donax TaxID=35708 RepID=A0A0A9H2H3_ARUDO